MRAKCPYCDVGCAYCDDGFFESEFSDGPIFVLNCTDADCGFANGAQILGPELPPLSRNLSECMMCEAPVTWELYGWCAPDPKAQND